MSGKLNHYYTKMDRLLALDSRYKRPGHTMDMNDCAYLYTLAVYSLLMLKELGVQVDTRLELPCLMEGNAAERYLYGMEYCIGDDDEDDDEDNASTDYYDVPWLKMYEPYTGCLSKKNAFWELSDFMFRYFRDIKEKNNLGLWTVFSEEDCMELCSAELSPGADMKNKEALIQAVVYFMFSHGSEGMLPSMGIECSGETENEVRFTTGNTLFVNGVFVLTSAKAEKVAAALESRGIHGGHAKGFLEKCSRLNNLLWRPGTTILADYTNNYEIVTRSQIIGTDNDFNISFEYAEFSPLLPVYLYYLEKSAEAVDSIYFGGQILKEGTDGKQKRED